MDSGYAGAAPNGAARALPSSREPPELKIPVPRREDAVLRRHSPRWYLPGQSNATAHERDSDITSDSIRFDILPR